MDRNAQFRNVSSWNLDILGSGNRPAGESDLTSPKQYMLFLARAEYEKTLSRPKRGRQGSIPDFFRGRPKINPTILDFSLPNENHVLSK